jgi:hypothetical protein
LIARDAHLVTDHIKLFHGVLPSQVELGVGVLGGFGQASRALVQEACDAHHLRLEHGDLRKDLLTFVATKRRRAFGFGIFRTASTSGRKIPSFLAEHAGTERICAASGMVEWYGENWRVSISYCPCNSVAALLLLVLIW